jgi:hypothetical protein
MQKSEVSVIGRCDGLGDLDREGSYVRLVYRNNAATHGIVISEGAAELLAAELLGSVAQKDDAAIERIMRNARGVNKG